MFNINSFMVGFTIGTGCAAACAAISYCGMLYLTHLFFDVDDKKEDEDNY